MKRTKSLTPPARNNSAAGDPFAQLETLSKNLWWSWQPQVPALFEALNPRAFGASNQNPIVALRKCGPAKRRALANDQAFTRQVRNAHSAFQKYLRAKTWFKKEYAGWSKGSVAYFCMEYALHESVPLYAGGLGVLAGDHLKSASDLGVPLVAVGIYWKKGYSRQQINSAGRQVHRIPRLDLKHMPLSEV
ncbi:MAG: glycosyltransferase family 1 protein, partial [Planctomycetes bacterium]|nr:glycosyltransferase family 1 protein [Planctomycetota bacterium]